MPDHGLSGMANLAKLHNNTASWWFKDPGLRRLALATLVGFFATVSNGYDGSLMTGLQADDRFMAGLGHPSSDTLGLIVAGYNLGGLPGMIPASWLADRVGRRITLGIGCLVIILGGCIQAFTTGPWKMFGGRFVVGLGSILSNVSGSPYASEIAHPRNRPQTMALINCCWYVGSIIAAWVSFGTIKGIKNDWSWRLPCLIQVVPPLLQLIALPFCPESPRFLVSRGKVDEAHRMLAKYHANGDMDDELVLFELQEIKEAIQQEREATTGISYMSFFRTKGNRHRLAIVIMVAFFSQWVGNGIISYYLVDILRSVGITDSTQQTGFNGGLQIFNLFAAVGGSMLCERAGRRRLWLTSAIGMLVSFVIITACSAAYADLGKAGAGPAVLAFLFVYFGFYDIAFTGLTVAYPLEILPFSLRTKGYAIQQFCVCCASFFNSYVNPIALTAIAWKYYFVYIGILLVAITCIFFFYPETRGRTLEEVAEIFDGDEAALSTTIQNGHNSSRQDSFGKDGLAEEQIEYNEARAA